MKKPYDYLRNYLYGDAQVMQLATSTLDGRPWVASVYFVVDDALNLYWLSWPERRHSQQLADNPYAAATIVIKPDTPVAGIQVSGRVVLVQDLEIVRGVMDRYVAKYQQGEEFVDRMTAQRNHHQLYMLQADSYQLFDEMVFPATSPVHIKVL